MSVTITPAFESEKTLIGGLLLDCTLFEEIRKMLMHSDFTDRSFQIIFQTMNKLYNKKGCFDVALISEESDINLSYLLKLINECPSTANIKCHADIIREKSVQRQLSDVASELINCEEDRLTQKEWLCSFLQETASEINFSEITKEYLSDTLFEISKVFVSVSESLEYDEMN